jgi:hypothetical protein
MAPHRDDVTRLLRAPGDGDEEALHQLMPLVEREFTVSPARAWRATVATTASRRRRSSTKHSCAWWRSIESTGGIARTSSRLGRG